MSVADAQPDLRELAERSNAWPFEEARKIVARLQRAPKNTDKNTDKNAAKDTATGPRGCPISAPSARSHAPPWCAMPSGCSPTTRSRPG